MKILTDFLNCDNCKIFFAFAYSIVLAFLYNFVRVKNKIIILFFLPLLLTLKDYNYFIAAAIFTLLSYFLGYILNNYRKNNNKKRKKEDQVKIGSLTVFFIFWITIYIVPFVIFPMLCNDGGFILLYLFFVPVSFSFIPYTVIYSDNQLANVKFLIFGLIIPCILNNILISYIISLAVSHLLFL
ncbi:MAG: hypothetical protein WC349_02025 [Patescibacteria group bacterium]|jgi:hypothetical protein